MKIYIIHKEKNSLSSLRANFDDSSHFLEEVCLEEIGLKGIEDMRSDIMIFDVTDSQGVHEDSHLIQKIRESAPTVPLLLATSASESSQYREMMLNAGVDGCIQIPFLSEELMLRIEKLVTKKDTLLFSGTKIEARSVEMDIRNHTVNTGEGRVPLTKTEYRILFHLFLHKNSIVSYRELLGCLDEKTKENPLVLNIHICKLRKKIKDAHIIRTIPMYGFTISSMFSAR
jgi:DNA-binding response OmpR family regulator